MESNNSYFSDIGSSNYEASDPGGLLEELDSSLFSESRNIL